MLTLISPAKSQNFCTNNVPTDLDTQIMFKEKVRQIVLELRNYSLNELETLMKISPKLAQKVHNLYVNFDVNRYTDENSRQALFAFNGDVYHGLDAFTLLNSQINYAQNHLLILSGLYGLLRPLDRIQPYRLEMGVNFYLNNILLNQSWKKIISSKLSNIIIQSGCKTIVNLASSEYSKIIDRKLVRKNAMWFDINFQDYYGGKYKTIGILAKRARGKMMRYIIEHKVCNVDKLKEFNYEGYSFIPDYSKNGCLCFRRRK